ncbi:cytochrome P450 [Alkalihalobacillus sp. MEB130]|uniref:cytochrome P450 n=1 Tax=Alkalihalobacillus sp. MEB130 TaxID=2976704 RepID=UPI0028DF0111|nr:cytochrome P450 [Alkalihalobacillus sp. MEB130]MDT8861589.1 cytochrome P450 [Alkalihalobacillus sp. MEB130]
MTEQSRNRIKVPSGKWLTGHLTDFQKDPLTFLTMLSREYKDMAQIRFGPFTRVYVVSNPNLIKKILVTKQTNFRKSQDLQILKDVVGEGLLTSEKDVHLRQRRLIQPSFRHSHINRYANDMIKTTSDYIEKWEDKKEYNMSDEMMNITLGIISKTMFSMDFDEGVSKIGEPMETYMRLAIKRMRSISPLPLWVPTKANKKYKQSIHSLNEVIASIINNRRQDDRTYEDLLGVLLQARDERDGLGMTDDQLKDELMTIFLAGHETTANALTWTMYLLAENPGIAEKLSDEIDRVIGNNPVEPKHFKDLSYTQNIISESLRLYPPAYLIGRQVIKDVRIGTYSLKKGDMVIMSQYAMHRNDQYFDEPDTFKPERFENNFVKTIPTYAYFPFGGGPRVCIGNHFAMMESVLVLACIAQRFRWKLAPNHHRVKPQPLITLRPKHGLRMVLEERN